MTSLSTDETYDAVASVTKRVRALGGLLPADGRLSWIADGVTGFAPLHCYLIETESGPMVLDSGAPILEPAETIPRVKAGLRIGSEHILDRTRSARVA